MKGLRKAFFQEIIDARNALESEGKTEVIENIPSPERLYEYLQNVGVFLVRHGVITRKDYDLAGGMIEAYEDRLDARRRG